MPLSSSSCCCTLLDMCPACGWYEHKHAVLLTLSATNRMLAGGHTSPRCCGKHERAESADAALQVLQCWERWHSARRHRAGAAVTASRVAGELQAASCLTVKCGHTSHQPGCCSYMECISLYTMRVTFATTFSNNC